jgi:predicted acyl esterase
MFSKVWCTSERRYNVVIERNVRISMRDGGTLDTDVFRPDAKGNFPAIRGFHLFRKDF